MASTEEKNMMSEIEGNFFLFYDNGFSYLPFPPSSLTLF